MLHIRQAVGVTRTEPFLARTCDPASEFYAQIRRRLGEGKEANE